MINFYTNVAKVGNNILYRGIEDGKRINRKIAYEPTLFLPSKTESKIKTLTGLNVEPFNPGSMSDCRQFVERNSNVSGFEIYGNTRYEYPFIADNFDGEIEYKKELIRIANIDIEVGSENGFPEPDRASEEITAITLKLNDTYYAFGCEDYTPKEDNIQYIKCKNERDLIKQFIRIWSNDYPDIVTGWNIKFFDFPYLVNRIANIFGEDEAKKLSPWKKINARTVTMMGREQTAYDMLGIAIIDYMEAYRKFAEGGASRESYKLDYIAGLELGEKKVDYKEYGNLFGLYKQNFELFMDYNIHDVRLVEKLDNKLALIDLILTLAYDSKCNYQDVFTQVRMWDTLIYNYLREMNIVVPPQQNGDKKAAYEGAFVKEPQVGMHRWVVSFDLTSLYPHLMMQYNISPESFIEPNNWGDELEYWMDTEQVTVDKLLNRHVDTTILKEHKVTVTPNRQLFRVEHQGFLPKMLKKMYDDRAAYKKKALAFKQELQNAKNDDEKAIIKSKIARFNNLQLAKKVCLNSAYGAIGNEFFRFFDVRQAEAVTTSGQLSIRWIEKKINEYMNGILKSGNKDYIIAVDTDSVYIDMEDLVNSVFKDTSDSAKIIKFMDKICEEKFQPYIDKCYNELAEYVNAYGQFMKMKREALCDRAVWTATKKYALNVHNNEGVQYKEPEIKIVGLEAIRSSTPSACREKIKDSLKIVMNQDEKTMIAFIEDFRQAFKNLPPEDIAFPRGVNGVKEYADSISIYKKGTPINTRSALVHNYHVKAMGLEKSYPMIGDGEKIKYIYLKEPNKFKSNIIAFVGTPPKEFELEKYVDYNLQFDKSFLEPIKTVLNAIGWKTEETNSLEDMWQ